MSGRDEFISALARHAGAFGVQPDDGASARLADYFDLIGRWNARLHLVAPCAPAEFAVRHVLESLAATPFLPPRPRAADVGTGGGLPILPCLLYHDELEATLYESSAKKATFLREAVTALGLRGRARVVHARFEESAAPDVSVVTCRALERFKQMMPKLLKWSPPRARLLLFGGEAVREALERAGREFTPVLLPESERRFLFVVRAATEQL